MLNPASAPWDPGGGYYGSTTGGCGGCGRRLLSSAVPSPPTKTVRKQPAARPNLPDSSDESEGGVMEAFSKRQTREDQLRNVKAEAGVATANTMTAGPPAVLPAGSPATVGPLAGTAMGFNEGLAVGAAVVGLDEGLAVGAAVVGIDQGIDVGESVDFDKGLAVGESVGIDQVIAVGESVGFEVGEEEEDDEDEGE